ncbi:unnamed protein product, partial [marine sediment metagenome]
MDAEKFLQYTEDLARSLYVHGDDIVRLTDKMDAKDPGWEFYENEESKNLINNVINQEYNKVQEQQQLMQMRQEVSGEERDRADVEQIEQNKITKSPELFTPEAKQYWDNMSNLWNQIKSINDPNLIQQIKPIGETVNNIYKRFKEESSGFAAANSNEWMKIAAPNQDINSLLNDFIENLKGFKGYTQQSLTPEESAALDSQINNLSNYSRQEEPQVQTEMETQKPPAVQEDLKTESIATEGRIQA